MTSTDDPLYRLGRARYRQFVVEFVRLRLTGHGLDGAARSAVSFAFRAYARPAVALRKGRKLLADPLIAAAVASRLPATLAGVAR